MLKAPATARIHRPRKEKNLVWLACTFYQTCPVPLLGWVKGMQYQSFLPPEFCFAIVGIICQIGPVLSMLVVHPLG